MNRLVSTLSKQTRLCYLQHTNLKLHYRLVGHVSTTESEYSDTPLYPPIEKISLAEKWRKKKQGWHSKIQDLPTVEQKLIELNMPKYYGYSSAILKEETMTPACLEFLKFVTRTQLIHNLPNKYYEGQTVNLEKAVNSIRDSVKELIALHFSDGILRDSRLKTEDQLKQAQNENFIIDLNNLIMKCVHKDAPHLSATSVDLRPRVEGFWFVGGFKPPNILKKSRESLEWMKPYVNDPVDRAMRSSVRPTVVLRTKHGLPEVLPLDGPYDYLPQEADDEGSGGREGPPESGAPVEEDPPEPTSGAPHFLSPFETDPKAHGFPCRRKAAVIIPGFWPGEENEHGHIFFHSRAKVNSVARKYGHFGPSLLPVFLQQRAVLAGFTQAMSYALYRGFTPVNELTGAPVVQQHVSTDGRSWQFGLYQLNTCCLHSHLSTDNPRNNLLWLSEDMKLFEAVEGNSVKGLNDDVLKLLCSMYLKRGEEIDQAAPYLADYKYLMHHPAPDEHKSEFQYALQHRLSERPFMHPRPEILPWEMIYKVMFKTRPIERKTKFFENRWTMNPYTRRMDEYQLPYIPKVRRVNHKIKNRPRINSEHLYKHDWHTLKRLVIYSDDHVAFNTMNTNWDTPPYYNGLLWSRGMSNKTVKI